MEQQQKQQRGSEGRNEDEHQNKPKPEEADKKKAGNVQKQMSCCHLLSADQDTQLGSNVQKVKEEVTTAKSTQYLLE